jgi:hypothetical protein
MNQTEERNLPKHGVRIVHLLKYQFIATAMLISSFSALFLLMPGGPAQAQPTLSFLNNPLKLMLASKQDTDKKCNPETGRLESVAPGESTPDLKTTKATVWVRYTDSEDTLENLRFTAQGKANTSGRMLRCLPGRTSPSVGNR